VKIALSVERTAPTDLDVHVFIYALEYTSQGTVNPLLVPVKDKWTIAINKRKTVGIQLTSIVSIPSRKIRCPVISDPNIPGWVTTGYDLVRRPGHEQRVPVTTGPEGDRRLRLLIEDHFAGFFFSFSFSFSFPILRCWV
jgi:hypothetical protein